MVSIQTALETIALEKYTEPFQAAGISTLDDLLALSVDQLTQAMNSVGMLKGHTFKLKKFVDDTKLKGFNPTPTPAPVITPPAPAVHKETPASNGNSQPAPTPAPSKTVQKNDIPEAINPTLLSSQMDGLTKQLNGMIALHDQVTSTLKAILDVDLNKYKKAIEEIEQVQVSLKAFFGKQPQKDIEMQG
ncbi:unnamed protein product [Blepharisma stoltei]|uniref:SAM domain-containing protein n=1 Tax=Blepharisma stoltei TaxID=1481888 RepID=A0AAU9IJP3_9CILI|nr:unnamed protein product [Blepharisma stoltei]